MGGLSVTTSAAFALTVLANGLWQAALLAGAAWLVLRLAPRANATTRHAVLVAALVGGLILPIVTTAVSFGHATPATPVITTTGSKAVLPRAPQQHIKLPAGAAVRAGTNATAQRAATAPAAPPRTNLLLTLPAVALFVLVGLWLLGALVLVGRLAFSLLYLERLKHDALPLPLEYRTRLERWDAAGKGARDVRLCRSSEIAVPIAVGIFDAMILVPERLLEDLSPEDLDRILLHELAHLRRSDDWLNALERTIEALLFFNPGIRWINRQLDVEREVACDDWVLERRNEALPYAQCLVKLVEGVAWPYRPMPAPGVFVTRRSISIRIERLLAKQRDVRLRIAPAPLGALAAIAALACVLGVYVSPSFAAGTAPAQPASVPPVVAKQNTHSLKRAASTQLAAKAPAHVVARVEPSPEPTSVPTSSAAPVPSPSILMPPKMVAAAAPAKAATPPPHTVIDVTVNRMVHTDTHAAAARSGVPATAASSVLADLRSEGSAAASSAKRDEDFIADMAAAGYTNLSVDELIRLKSIGVTGAYVREMQAAGFGHPAVHELEELKATGVTPQFVGDMHRTFPGISTSDIVSLRALGVTSSYVADMRATGVKQLTADTIRSMRAVGVDPAYVRQLAAAGYPNLSADQLTQLRAVGVDAAFLKKVQDHGFHNLPLDQLVRLRTSGVLVQ